MKLLCAGIEHIEESKFLKIKNQQLFNKPIGGLWSSPFRENDTYKSHWLEWCSEECFNKGDEEHGVIFELVDEARVLTIDGIEDLKEATLKYEAKNELEMFDRKYLDFEKLSNDYDAIYLTRNGEQKTRYTFEYSLYGWDVETILVLNYEAIKKSSIKKISID